VAKTLVFLCGLVFTTKSIEKRHRKVHKVKPALIFRQLLKNRTGKAQKRYTVQGSDTTMVKMDSTPETKNF